MFASTITKLLYKNKCRLIKKHLKYELCVVFMYKNEILNLSLL